MPTHRDKWFPNVLKRNGELDVQEVFQSTRLAWESIYLLQSDIEGTMEVVRDRMEEESLAQARSPFSPTIGPQRRGGGGGAAQQVVLNATRNTLPYLGSSLIFDSRDAPEYNPDTKALTIAGAITGRTTLSITGAATLSSTLGVTGATTLSSTLSVIGLSDFQAGVTIDVDAAEAFLVRQDGDAGDVFVVNTATPGVAITGALTLSVPLAVPQGGTGAATFTDHGLMVGSGSGILTVLAEASNGQLPIGSAGNDPVLASLTGTANQLTVTDGAGSITLSLPATVILPGSLEVTTSLEVVTTSLFTGIQTLVGATEFQTKTSLSNTAEGNTASIDDLTAHETHTLTLGASSVTTTITIPIGSRLSGVSFNVNTAVTDDAGDDTWDAAFSGGSTTPLITGAAPALDTKVDVLIVDEITTGSVTEITFTPNGGNFTAGVIEIVVYYEALTSLANV